MKSVVAIALALAFVSLDAHQEQRRPTVPQERLDARTLLLEIYPELQGKPLSIQFAYENESDGMVMEVGETVTQSRDIVMVPETKELLTSAIKYEPDRTLTSFRASGPLLNDEDNARLRERLKGTSSQREAVMADEGSRFGVKTAATLLSTASLDKLSAMVGTIAVTDTELRTVADDEKSHYGAVWEVTAQVTKGAGPSHEYRLEFEPYGGRLVGLRRQVAR